MDNRRFNILLIVLPLAIVLLVLLGFIFFMNPFPGDISLTGNVERRFYGGSPCRSDSACREGNICINGSCVAGQRQVPVQEERMAISADDDIEENITCTTNADCATGQYCLNNGCRTIEETAHRILEAIRENNTHEPEDPVCECGICPNGEDAGSCSSGYCRNNTCENTRDLIESTLGTNVSSNETDSGCYAARPSCYEGAACCSDGVWHCNRGDGTSTCPEANSSEEFECECGTCPNGEYMGRCPILHVCSNNQCLTFLEWLRSGFGHRDSEDDAEVNTSVVETRSEDADEDGIPDVTDNCPLNANSGQQDRDRDGRGDACDTVESDIDDCIASFMENEDLYTAVNAAFPGKVRVYPSDDPPADAPGGYVPSTDRQVIIINDLWSDTELLESIGVGGYDDLTNKVVSVLFGNPDSIPSDNRDHKCIKYESDYADSIDRNHWKSYYVEIEGREGLPIDYQISVGIGFFMPYLRDLLNICEQEIAADPVFAMTPDGVGYYIQTPPEEIDLVCDTTESPCLLYRAFAAAIDCRGSAIQKGFNDLIENHCPGMALEIRMSGLVPTGHDYREEGICEVYEGAGR